MEASGKLLPMQRDAKGVARQVPGKLKPAPKIKPFSLPKMKTAPNFPKAKIVPAIRKAAGSLGKAPMKALPKFPSFNQKATAKNSFGSKSY